MAKSPKLILFPHSVEKETKNNGEFILVKSMVSYPSKTTKKRMKKKNKYSNYHSSNLDKTILLFCVGAKLDLPPFFSSFEMFFFFFFLRLFFELLFLLLLTNLLTRYKPRGKIQLQNTLNFLHVSQAPQGVHTSV